MLDLLVQLLAISTHALSGCKKCAAVWDALQEADHADTTPGGTPASGDGE